MNIMKRFIVVFSLVLLGACGNSDVQVIAHFDNTQDIKEGSKVYYEGEKIGTVSDVSIEQSGSTIEIDLKPKAAKKLAAKSAIVVNRLKKGAPLEIYNRVAIGSEKMQTGQEIEGLDSMFQLGAWMVGDVVKTGSDSFSQYVGAFQEYLDGEDFEKGKQQVQKEIQSLTQSTTVAVKGFEKELNAAIEEFSVNEEQIAQTIEQLGDELSPVVEEVARSSSELVGELEQFIINMEGHANLSEQQSGEKLLESLVETFEKLNESIEDGVKQAEKSTSK